MNVKTQRFLILLASLFCLSIGSAYILTSFQENISFFYSPSELQDQNPPLLKKIRLGGMVVKDSIEKNGTHMMFRLTDFKADIGVEYQGIAPDLFREGQGIVAEGTLIRQDLFKADTLLAKHDENYMPPELSSLRESKP
ncbi:MAG: cytochrome c maturation protein CcmE [Alphaproteobacteria bacterium]|nr:cytochrome c maturation protein CcmE [Alphaproteobacteria bacterium]